MTNRVQEIREASAKLDSLNERIKETLRTRDRGFDERERWNRACEEFHEPPRKTRAEYLLAYEKGAAAGGRKRVQVFREWLAQKYRARRSRV